MPSKRYLSLIILASSIMAVSPTYAANNDKIERAGEVIAIAIPAIAYGSTYYKDDKVGRQQFYYAFGTTAATTLALKSVVDKKRPDGSDNDSFPSGHTSVAFQGASFLHKRYGFEYSIPAYIGAGFVAYSRIKSDQHDAGDVFAGAALGIASSLYLTKSFDDQLHISTTLSPEYSGLTVNYQF